MRTPIILTIGLLTSCAQQEGFRVAKSLPNEIREYYSRFHEYYGIDPNYVSVEFVDDVKGDDGTCSAVATCTAYPSGLREIVIEKPYWDELGDYGKEELIFHELGHCAFDRGHDESVRDDGCYASIMNPYVFGDTLCYSDHRDELIIELGE